MANLGAPDQRTTRGAPGVAATRAAQARGTRSPRGIYLRPGPSSGGPIPAAPRTVVASRESGDDVRPGLELARRLQADGTIGGDVVSAGSRLVAFPVLPAD